jgi:uncharacterized protein
VPLFAEYEAIISRPETQRRCPLAGKEQIRLFDAFLSRTKLIEVYYRWRPNVRDEGDNHVLELAVAAGDAPIVLARQSTSCESSTSGDNSFVDPFVDPATQ